MQPVDPTGKPWASRRAQVLESAALQYVARPCRVGPGATPVPIKKSNRANPPQQVIKKYPQRLLHDPDTSTSIARTLLMQPVIVSEHTIVRVAKANEDRSRSILL